MWETLLFKTKLLLCRWRVLLHSSEPTGRQTGAHRCHRAKWQMDHKGFLLCPVWKASLRMCSHPKALDIHVSPGSRWFEFLIRKRVFIAIQRLCLGFSKDVDKEEGSSSVTESDRIPHVSTPRGSRMDSGQCGLTLVPEFYLFHWPFYTNPGFPSVTDNMGTSNSSTPCVPTQIWVNKQSRLS